MAKQTVTIKGRDGEFTIPVQRIPVTGLAVHKMFNGLDGAGHPKFIDGLYTVTHVNSGMACGQDFDRQKTAIKYAELLAKHYPVNGTEKELLDAVRNRGDKPAPASLKWEAGR